MAVDPSTDAALQCYGHLLEKEGRGPDLRCDCADPPANFCKQVEAFSANDPIDTDTRIGSSTIYIVYIALPQYKYLVLLIHACCKL